MSRYWWHYIVTFVLAMFLLVAGLIYLPTAGGSALLGMGGGLIMGYGLYAIIVGAPNQGGIMTRCEGNTFTGNRAENNKRPAQPFSQAGQ